MAAPDPTGDRPGASTRRHGPIHPMYVQLLDAVLADDREPTAPVPSVGPSAELVQLRHAMEKHAGRTDPGWALQAVADELAYDAALVRLARSRGVVVDTAAFDIPDYGRVMLERALTARRASPHAAAPRSGDHTDGSR